jgi:threonine/homoserine/homoserine lactone efflux protein
MKSALPAIAGIVAGGLVLITLSGIGLDAVATRWPWLDHALVAAGAVYLGALGLRLLYRSVGTPELRSEWVPAARLGAPTLFALQFANPKAWVLVLTVSAAAHRAAAAPFVLPLLFVAISTASLLVWAGLGHLAARILHGGVARARFDRVMGVLLIAFAGAGWHLA